MYHYVNGEFETARLSAAQATVIMHETANLGFLLVVFGWKENSRSFQIRVLRMGDAVVRLNKSDSAVAHPRPF